MSGADVAMCHGTCVGSHVQNDRWGASHWAESPLSQETGVKYDYIILAEVFSIPAVHEELVWSVQQFCHADVSNDALKCFLLASMLSDGS